jgi:Domain of unknown function (DUF6456)
MARPRLRAARRNAQRRERYRQAREAAIELGEQQPKRRRYARSRTALEHLMTRGLISPEQMRAGDKLASDYRTSQTDPSRLTGRYEPGPRPPQRYQAAPDTLASLAARERFESAMAAVAAVQAGLAGILVHVCVVDQPVNLWGPLNGYPVTAGILRLHTGLDILADYYGARRRAAA